ncbi:asparaginase [Vallitalea guaymasensis]|uniref:asparaginase n=1 Tax=Vallitalea guaymasensis TaxID=1185412 RepID=A0A8J8MBD3_9FIRM|nr:asparaginase [Vallitalea guaymasensis]QUH29595.1 asparaginase [Vallitalea guaymasensis]
MKKVALIFTGGTISMMVDERLKAAIPALSDKDIISKVSGIEKMAQIEVIHYGAYPGPHIVPNMMLDIARVTNELLSREDIAGVVITHGTDTLEETAYFLDLVINSEKPVVVTGSMRNGSELGYDGPANLAASICTVCSEESKNKGVLVVMNNQVNAADEVTKTHTLSLDTFQSMDFGPLGIVDSDQVIYYRNRKKASKIVTENIENRVALIKAVAGLGSEFIDYLVDNDYRGIVIEALGRGNLPPTMLEGIRRAIDLNIPVVIVSRCSKGRVLDSYGYQGGGRQLRDMGVILGDNLSGQKARIKLMIVLGVTKDVGEVRQIFEKDLYKKI